MSEAARNALSTVPLSVLDLAPIVQGGTPAQALRNSTDLARHAERLGYHRFWVAEHHGMPSVASAATAVVIGHIAANTSTIRVGAGGIMLPNQHRSSLRNNSAHLTRSFPAALISASAARPARTRPLRGHCGEVTLPQIRSLMTSPS